MMICLSLLAPLPCAAKRKKPQPASDQLSDYIARARAMTTTARVTGSLWTQQSPYLDMGGDYKARNVNDVIVVEIVEQTTAAQDGAVKSQRTFSASSSINALLGVPGANNALQNIFSPNSSRALNGQAQTSSDSSLTTSLSGRVVEVLPNGFLVIEAERQVEMNNQHQTLIIRGVVRPGDISSTNSILSTSIANMEIVLKGRGVISDGVSPPNRLIRAILWIVGF